GFLGAELLLAAGAPRGHRLGALVAEELADLLGGRERRDAETRVRVVGIDLQAGFGARAAHRPSGHGRTAGVDRTGAAVDRIPGAGPPCTEIARSQTRSLIEGIQIGL